jgi:tRNA (cytidine/uridine-2'-O-)-methyltransferase
MPINLCRSTHADQPMPINIALYQPENPHNTGGIARTCAMLGARLHLIRPYGFGELSRQTKRSSMNYLLDAQLIEHDSWQAFMMALEPGSRVLAFAASGATVYTDAHFQAGDYLLFGRESNGLPEAILEQFPTLRIPMPGSAAGPRRDHRLHSLNLSVSVGIAAFEAARQITHGWK